MLTQKYLKSILLYRKDGLFIASAKRRTVKAGDLIEGYIDSTGYRILSIGNINRKYHRVVFLYHHGYLPKNIDHINRDKADCRIENLRPATTSQNMANIVKYRGAQKYKGVSLVKRTGRYISHIRKDGKLIHIGYFATPEEAANAYDETAKKLFGNFSKLNLS